ncbi:hypothetical protein Rs2_13931 [Raphanus sativus]|nr:hypothetical protein Rs2_13931 [Raphanus sativus]
MNRLVICRNTPENSHRTHTASPNLIPSESFIEDCPRNLFRFTQNTVGENSTPELSSFYWRADIGFPEISSKQQRQRARFPTKKRSFKQREHRTDKNSAAEATTFRSQNRRSRC